MDDSNSDAVFIVPPISNLIKPEARRRIYWTNVSINTKVWGLPGPDVDWI
ncbi:MAG TPA: hypothetical protein VGK96_14190 [Candidatus Sulfotelmatobacter sp.]